VTYRATTGLQNVFRAEFGIKWLKIGMFRWQRLSSLIPTTISLMVAAFRPTLGFMREGFTSGRPLSDLVFFEWILTGFE
jgi:hypothetical protein